MTDKVLLTGVSGWIAKHTAIELLNAGYEVLGTVRNNALIEQTKETISQHASINKFLKKFKKNSYFKSVVEDIKKVKKLKSKPHSLVVKKLGMACSYPGTFNSSIHSIINSSNYKGAILRTIKAGGCNCSRVNFIGAYFAALKGVNSIPKSWIKKTDPAKKILNQK